MRKGVALLLLIPLLVLACGRQKTARDGPEEGVLGSTAPRPPMPIVAVPEEPDQLVPQLARSASSAAIWSLILPSLVRYESDSLAHARIVGDLAVRWEFDEDRKGIRFDLAGTRFWEDTTAVSIDDVIESYRLYRDRDVAGNWPALLVDIVSVEESPGDPGRVHFIFRRPLSRARALQLASLPIISYRQWIESLDRRPVLGEAGRPVQAAGPFRIEEWREGEYIRLARHPFAPADRLPRAPRVLVRFVPSGRGRAIQVELGAADIAVDLPIEDVRVLRDRAVPGLRLIPCGPAEIEALVWNLDHPHWSGTMARHAISRLVDVGRLRRAAAMGDQTLLGQRCSSFLEAAGADTTASAPADSSIGAIDPSQLGIYGLQVIFDRADQRRERIAVELAMQLDRAGIHVELAPCSETEINERIANRRFDLLVAGYRAAPAADVGEIWETGGAANIAGLADRGVDSLVVLARSAAADSMPAVWKRVERRAMALEPLILIDRRQRIEAVAAAVRGYRPRPLDPYGDLLHLERTGADSRK